MKIDELYDHIVKHMTPEEALKKLLSSHIYTYQHLKLKGEEKCHPEMIIAMAALDLGWQLAINKDDEHITGLVVGTEEYLNKIFPEKKDELRED